MSEPETNDGQLAAKLRELEIANPGIGGRAFEQLAGVHRTQWQSAFGTRLWSEVREKILGNPNESEVPLAPGLEAVCKWILMHKQFPPLDEIRLMRDKGAPLPHPSNLSGKRASKRWGGSWDGFKQLVGSYALERPEYAEVARVLGVQSRQIKTNEQESYHGWKDILSKHSFVPPIVESLIQLATVDAALERVRAAREFEMRVIHAFRAMGLFAEHLGGAEEADGLVRTPRIKGDDDWALIVDAKRWTQGFKMNVEERRKLRDYAKKHGGKLSGEGYDRRYFVFVSTGFDASDSEKAAELLHDLGDAVKHVVFMETAALVRLVERRISTGLAEFSNGKISRLMKTGILSEDDVS